MDDAIGQVIGTVILQLIMKRYIPFVALVIWALTIPQTLYATNSSTGFQVICDTSYVDEDFEGVSTDSYKDYYSWITNGIRWTSINGKIAQFAGMSTVFAHYYSYGRSYAALISCKISNVDSLYFKAKRSGGDHSITIAYSTDSSNWVQLAKIDYVSTTALYQYAYKFPEIGDYYIRFWVNAALGKYVYLDDIRISRVACQDSYKRVLPSANIGTICLPKAVAEGDYSGATFYRIASKTGHSDNPTSMALEEVTALEAGKPYIFEPASDATEITLKMSGEAVSEAGNERGLYGTLTDIDESTLTPNTDLFMVAQNQIWSVGEGCTLAANRAYIKMSEVPAEEDASPVAGRHYLQISNSAYSTPAAIEKAQVEPTVPAGKLMRDGHFVIERNGQYYSVDGKLWK